MNRVDAAIGATKASVDAVSAALNVYVKSVRVNSEDAVDHVASKALVDISKNTPVDTGRLRGGWFKSFDLLGLSRPGVRGKGVNPIAVMRGALEGSADRQSLINRYTITMRNGVRYAPFVEAGSSPQKPYGFVRPVLDRIADDLIEAVKRIETDGTK